MLIAPILRVVAEDDGQGVDGISEPPADEQAMVTLLSLDPDDPAPLRMSGDFLSMRGDFAGARRAYERHLALQPSVPAGDLPRDPQADDDPALAARHVAPLHPDHAAD